MYGTVRLRQPKRMELLPRKRKPRRTYACRLCREQKVKCDSKRPCARCIDRGCPEACASQSAAHNARPQSAPTELPLSSNHGLSQAVNDKAHGPDTSPYLPALSKGTCEVDEMTGGLVFLGAQSRAVFVQKFWGSRTKVDIGYDTRGLNVLSLFNLSNSSATYPFVNLWTSERGDFDLYNTIPADGKCMKFYHSYCNVAHLFFPVLISLEEFESELCEFLIARSVEPDLQPGEVVHGKTWVWIGLLFAVLAYGSQFSDLSATEGDMISGVLSCCSFECLRKVNFFLQPSLAIVQTLLLLGEVTKNSNNPGISWSLLGLTIRMAQTLGLHSSAKGLGIDESASTARQCLWRLIVWKESSMSLAYGRDPSILSSSSTAFPAVETSNRMSYVESMYAISALTLDMLHSQVLLTGPEELHKTLPRYETRLGQIESRVQDHLRTKRDCKSLRELQEHLMFRLHLSYTSSELYRPALRVDVAGTQQLRAYATACIDGLTSTVEAAVELQELSKVTACSWELSYRMTSSALLLGIFRGLHPEINVAPLVTYLDKESTVFSSEDTLKTNASATRLLRTLLRHGTTSKA